MNPNLVEDYLKHHRYLNWTVWALIVIGAFLLRLPHFSPLAVVGIDSGIYVYCATNSLFPHSPYIIHSLIGVLLRPFVTLDLGYSVVSMVSSLVSILFFMGMMERLYKSRLAGWIAGIVLACSPVCARFAGIQEIYALQFFFLSWSWYVLSGGRRTFLAGLIFGVTVATHSGTVFALPTTLILMCSAIRNRALALSGHEGEEIPLKINGHPLSRACPVAILVFLLGAILSGVLAVMWVAWLWFSTPGAPPLSDLPTFLRGSSPFIEWAKFAEWGVGYQILNQLHRTWTDLSSPEVMGSWMVVFGTLALLLQPWRITIPWWLLSLPYLVYEMLVTYSLDYGIYSVLIIPSIAVGLGLCASVPRDSSRSSGIVFLVTVFLVILLDGLDVGPAVRIITTVVLAFCIGMPYFLSTARIAVLVLALLLSEDLIEDFHDTAKLRRLMPWYRESGAPMFLSKWVHDNSPVNTMIFHPLDWAYSGYATALYAERIPMFGTADTLNLRPWQPIMQAFGVIPKVTVEHIENWLDQGVPLISYDDKPFSERWLYWKPEFAERFEARPILWFDRNQSGTSDLWKNVQAFQAVDVGNIEAEQQAGLKLPDNVTRGRLNVPVYHPTLYWLSRKSDPGVPDWVQEMRAKVPSQQVGAPSSMDDDGISIMDSQTKVYIDLPSSPGKSYILHHRLQTMGWHYTTLCSVKVNGKWVHVGGDMEQIVSAIEPQFTDFYYRVPARYVDGSKVSIKLSAAYGCKAINIYRLEWGVEEDASPNP